MANFNADRLQIAEQLRRSLASENQLTPNQARAFVRGLQISWRVPSIYWRDGESKKMLNDARRLIHAAEVFREIKGANSSEAKDCYRRSAELLEWLTRAEEPSLGFVSTSLMAAAAFQLGGLPAMATGLLSQIIAPDAGTRLFSKFLKGDFNGVVDDVLSFWKIHHDLTTRNSSALLIAHKDADNIEWYFTVELVRSIGLVATTLREGKFERLGLALQKLRALDKVASRTFGDDVSLMISLLVSVAEGYQATSIYVPVSQLLHNRLEQTERLSKFARDQFGRGRGILWPSQLRGLERLLTSSSFALCTPTGSGKTLVANLALVKELLLGAEGNLAPLALYIVPSRALAGEVETKLLNELGKDLVVTGLYGGADWGITDYWLTAERPTVLIATVEKADALMRYVGSLIVTRLTLLIIDEAHQVVPENRDKALVDFADHSSRSLRLESFVSRIIARKPDIARIALTAVAGGAATPVARWIEGKMDAEPIGTSYRSTRQLIGVLNAIPNNAGDMRIDMMNGTWLYVRGRDEPFYIPLLTPIMPQLPPFMRDSVYRFNQINVLWTALHLVESDRRVLISVAQEPEQTMRWFKEALELPDWRSVHGFKVSANSADQARFEVAKATCIDYCGESSYEVALLNHGIATSHGQMPQRLRRLMTDLIERRICPITLATATLTEGVNLPFDLIFILSLTRSSFDVETKTPIVTPLSTAEFRNLAGRAGRPGATRGMEGITLVAIPVEPSTKAPSKLALQRRQIEEMRGRYDNMLSSLSAERRSTSNILSPLTLLLKTLAERAEALLGLRGERFLSWLEKTAPIDISDEAGMMQSNEAARLADSIDELDGILLTAIEELSIGSDELISKLEIEKLLCRIWRSTFSHTVVVQEAWLESAFIRRGQGIVDNIYPDADERRRLYQYGFTPQIGRRFERIAPNIRKLLESAHDYGFSDAAERFELFTQLGELVANYPGFGFRGRNTIADIAMMDDWEVPLGWWLLSPKRSSPKPEALRAWQRFVSENFEFRLGVVVGAVVAQAWSTGTSNQVDVPTLDKWKQTTGLPWFGFWAKELLRWGTLDPFVAFSLAQGLSGTRSDAAIQKKEFESWMDATYSEIEAEDWIDPQYYLEWQKSRLIPHEKPKKGKRRLAKLTGANGSKERYSVHPVIRSEAIHWIDASGFELATTAIESIDQKSFRDDFELKIHDGNWEVRATFHLS